MLGLGFVLGLRHALEADHVAAVSAIASRSSTVWRSGGIGLCWGLGHTAVLLVAGLLVVGFKIAIPDEVAQGLECAVGLMLVVLGGSLAWTIYREEWHWHRHEHDGQLHRHLHHHREARGHNHPHWLDEALRPFVVGMVHGLAGSAALLLLVVSTVHTLPQALAYIALFGAGSIAGMVVVGILISWPLRYAEQCGPLLQLSLRGLVSLASVAVGLWTILETGLPGW